MPTAVKVLLPFFKTTLPICFSSRRVSRRDPSIAAFLLGFASLKQALMADFNKILSKFYFGGARSKGFTTLRNVLIGHAKCLAFRFYWAI